MSGARPGDDATRAIGGDSARPAAEGVVGEATAAGGPTPDRLGGVQVCPSILSADFARLGSQVDEVLAAGARVIHVDVMDGHFVPPITIGPLVAASIADRVHAAGAAIDVHLMVESPERHVAEFAAAGADSITFHAEATPHVHRVCGQIREHGRRAGVALNPGTAVAAAGALRGVADLVCAMTVNPGWGGQRYIESSPARIASLAADPGLPVEVDGGIDATTAPAAVAAGARLLVAGSAVFGAAEPAEAFSRITASARDALTRG